MCRELGIHPAPPTAIIPLGTGNGVSINFGWGKTIRPQWLKSPDAMTQVGAVLACLTAACWYQLGC